MNHGMMIKAQAWRVKYRNVDSQGRMVRVRTMIQQMGTHKGNRMGVYPSGPRCKSLAVDAFNGGFVMEEFSHLLVSVEQPPLEVIRTRGKDYESLADYNRNKCAADELLMKLYEPPFHQLTQALLAHNHMMVVLRAFIVQAQWNIPPSDEKGVTFCDADGKLSITAVAESMNGAEAAKLIAEGCDCEALSYKMDEEEPSAASLISQALNRCNEVALRTTEMQAVAALSGEIIAQWTNTELGQNVAFESVLENVRHKLDMAADDPDLIQVFDFLIWSGVGRNRYVDELTQFARVFVNAGKRQLRLSAFGVINQMPKNARWSSVAVLKRAYRKPPTNGFCPNPEHIWSKCKPEQIEPMEDLLRFLHVECKGYTDKLPPQSRDKAMADADIAIAEAFIKAKAQGEEKKKKATTVKDVKDILLAAAAPTLDILNIPSDERVSKRDAWIEWKDKKNNAAAKTGEHAENEPVSTEVRVMEYDEITGAAKNSQIDFSTAKEKTKPTKDRELPWKAWYATHSNGLGEETADKCATIAMLQSIHERLAVTEQDITVMLTPTNRLRVVANNECTEGEIMLAPCSPKASKALDKCEHPHAVEILMKCMTPTKVTDEPQLLRTRRLKISPEFIHPTAAADEAGADAEPKWEWGGQETMNPFWAVRRMTLVELATENKTNEGSPLRFNCAPKVHQMSAVNVGIVEHDMGNTTRTFDVPFITNTTNLKKGEELILEIGGAKAKAKNKVAERGWKDELKAITKHRKKAGTAAAEQK